MLIAIDRGPFSMIQWNCALEKASYKILNGFVKKPLTYAVPSCILVFSGKQSYRQVKTLEASATIYNSYIYRYNR